MKSLVRHGANNFLLRLVTKTVTDQRLGNLKLRSHIAVIIFSWAGLGSMTAHAGVPRDVVLTANEQDADAETGITIARGNAEIAAPPRAVQGRADTIELNPVAKKIWLKGHAVLNVGRVRYQSQLITCSLDFYSCDALVDSQPEPAANSDAVTNPR